MRLFYDPNIETTSSQHTLSEDESKHVIRVLRMEIGDRLILLNGIGGSFECEIIDANAKKCELRIVEVKQANPEIHAIHIAISPTKQMDRMEWFIEKATEIGVTEITFLNCTNSERVKLKSDRLERKAISAMKQSHRKFLPKINELISFDEFLKNHPYGLIAHCYDDKKQNMTDVFKSVNCPILIGPEGDFTKDEIHIALESGYKYITLGENRLRTETAALYACMQAKLIMG
jgi:16S rRNA (uracil1498-N3)-methyltransferase